MMGITELHEGYLYNNATISQLDCHSALVAYYYVLVCLLPLPVAKKTKCCNIVGKVHRPLEQ